MKIVEVETYPVGAGGKRRPFVKVLTNGSRHGMGEAAPNGPGPRREADVHKFARSRDTIAAALDHPNDPGLYLDVTAPDRRRRLASRQWLVEGEH